MRKWALLAAGLSLENEKQIDAENIRRKSKQTLQPHPRPPLDRDSVGERPEISTKEIPQ
jgi:hypothetical protein